MFKRAKLWLFDLLKKRSMEQYYRAGKTWGRGDDNADITQAVATIADRRYDRCLDVGAGLGHYTEKAARLCQEVLAIDISSKAIVQAQERLSGLPNVQFAVRNLRDAEISWGKFDLIILAEVLYYLGDERFPMEFRELLRRIANLLQEKGRILLVNYVSPGRSQEKLEAYTNAFVDAGLLLEKNEVIKSNSKTFAVAVLRK